ncbi:MAG: S1 RNA-binding domain-containing protein [Bacteroidales bacterium]|nr:S1 RNA-binding domain-containing protein [Bacteroidales bacterium]
MNLLGQPLDLVDNLASDIEKLSGEGKDGPDYAAILESAFNTLKGLFQMIKDFQNVEMRKIEGELEKCLGDAYEKFSLKDLAMSLLEYVFITILRNGREVFSEEIKYVKLQANSLYNSIQDTVADVKGKVQDGISDFLKQVEGDASKAQNMARTLFKETVQDMEDVYNSVASDLRKDIDQALNSQAVQDIKDAYEKVSSVLSKMYAILDFLGIVGKKTVEIKLPESFINKLNSAAQEVSKVIGDAAGQISGFVSDLTESANGAVNYAVGSVNALTGEARKKIEGTAAKIDDLTGTSLASLDITADLVDLPAVNIPDFSKDIASIGQSMQDAMKQYGGGAINYLKGLSFPINIVTFKWDKIEKMLSDPQTYFKEQYPVNSIEDAESIASKVIEISRLFNPLIPDFKSIRSLLESLLREIGEQVLSATKEIRNELWEQIKPLMTMIRKVIDILEEMYETLKHEAHTIIQEIRRTVIEEIINPVSDAASNLSDDARDFVKRVKDKIDSITVPKNVNEVYENIIKPSLLEAIKKSTAPDPEKVVEKLQSVSVDSFTNWGTGISTHLSKFFSEKEWKDRLDGTISALETTFAGDVNAVKSFLSPSSLDDIASMGSRASELKDQLDINQYIKVISEAFEGVSVPNPQLYYEGFKQCVSSILSEAQKQGAKFKEDQIKTFVADVASGMWEKIRNKVINPIIKEVKKQIVNTVRTVIKNAIKQIIDQLPSFKDLKTLSVSGSNGSSAAPSVKVYSSEAKDRIKDTGTLGEHVKAQSKGPASTNAAPPKLTTDEGSSFSVDIGSDWIEPTKKIALATIEFSTSDLSYSAVIKFVVALYKAIPESAKKWISDILPSMPEDETIQEFCSFVKGMDYKADLDESFAILTVLDAKSDDPDKKEGDPADKERPAPNEKDKDGTKFKASALLQLVVFAGEVPEEPKEEKKPKEQQEQQGQQGQQDPLQVNGQSQSLPWVQDNPFPSEALTEEEAEQERKKKEEEEKKKDKDKEEKEPEPALYCMLIVKGNVGLTFNIGSNHVMSLSVDGGVGGGKVEKVDEETSKKLQKGIGFYITKGWDFNGVTNWDALNAMFLFEFKRKFVGQQKPAEGQKPQAEGQKPTGGDKDNNKDKDKEKKKKEKNLNTLKVFDTKYLSMEVGNYPQLFYLGYSAKYPGILKEEFGIEEEEKKDKGDGKSQQSKGQEQPQAQAQAQTPAPTQGQTPGKDGEPGKDKKKPAGNSLQVGYIGAVQDASITLHLQDVAFVKEVLKDDIALNFDTYLWYDYHKGFDFGGDVSLHMDFDLNHKKLGPVTIDTFSLEAGSLKDQKGKLGLVVGTTFQLEMSPALVVAVEDLGVGLVLKYKDEEGNFGDFDLDGSIKYPSGFGITVDASAVKGGGFISIDQQTGEFFGVLDLNIINKIGVGGFLLCDPGTAKGHEFSLVVLLSARFNPGVPLGMGFSLTAVGGTLGLNRELSRDAIQNGVRTGSLDQVFFVSNIKDHLSEMKSNVLTYFPVKKGQFFFGILGEITFEPIVKCDFGLLIQLPKPTEFIIVGALKVNAAEGLVRINVFFGGGINFEEGMWFDASIVDSQIVGISISGDMAFRLNWGGQKGFLLSIGGFHPAYKPEEGLHVGSMKRLAMKLDYSILKISFESYLAVTSNSFQIGARFDLKVGWDKFGITGYASFDALFQFDPFLFMFNVSAGVGVKCGDWTLLSIDLALDVQGPAPWIVSGFAKFSFLLIPVEVSFTKSWGESAPELPSKTVEVFPLLVDEWKKDNNWSVDNGDIAGNSMVVLFGHESSSMVLQPDGSLTFNQSAIPFYTQNKLDKMDLCNDAVPTDYDSLKLSVLNGQVLEKAALEQNDFAPALYKKMSIKEKLDSESYVKYNSGFTLNEKDKLQSKGNETVLKRSIQYEAVPLGSASAARSEGNAIANIVSKGIDAASNDHRNRASFDRYVAAMEQRLDGVKLSREDEEPGSNVREPKVGDIYRGKVKTICEYGAYLDIIPGFEALLHINEISWEKISKVEDVLKVGQEVEVKLIDIDYARNRINLSRRVLFEKPPVTIDKDLVVGNIYHGKVSSVVPFGAFVEILPGKEGLLHITEVSWERTENVEDVLKEGQEVDVKLIDIDPNTRKMKLSRKALLEKPAGFVEHTNRPRPGIDDGSKRDERDRIRNSGSSRVIPPRAGEERNRRGRNDRGSSNSSGRNDSKGEKPPVTIDKDLVVGNIYHGKVSSILPFGAFVEILPGKEGLLHITEVSWERVETLEGILSVGQELDVILVDIDSQTGKLKLSLRQLQEKP